MLQELRIKNFLSFKEEVVFSFEATSDKNLSEYYIIEPKPGIKLLKIAIIYGANASGKSNLINAFGFLKKILFEDPTNKDEPIDFHPFAFDKTNIEPGEFKLIFYSKSTKYIYHLIVDNRKIHFESLIYYPGKQPAVVFERTLDKHNLTSKIKFGLKISKTAKEEIIIKTLINKSVFRSYRQVNISIPEFENAIDWLSANFKSPLYPDANPEIINPAAFNIATGTKKLIIKNLNEADFNISNIIYKKSKDNELDFNLFFEHKIIQNNQSKHFELPAERESKGTIRYFNILQTMVNIILQGSFLPIDEIESSLHPLLVKHFIKEFLYQSKTSQVLLTTHDISLLNEKDILRKDAIWFTEKKKDGSTDLYSASDFPEFRKELSFYNFYKTGKFGAVPNIE